MPDLLTLLVLLTAAAALDASPLVRIPIGLVVAIGTLAQDVPTVPAVVAAAVGIALGRLCSGLLARRAGESADVPPLMRLQQTALGQQLTNSPNATRLTIVIAAAPGVPRDLLFPLLGRMRLRMWPAVLGTILGKTPIILLTTLLFTGLGLLGTDGDDPDAAVLLGVVAGLLLILRTIASVDWAHRSATGQWRARHERRSRTTAWFGAMPMGSGPFGGPPPVADDGDIVEGEVLGEEILDQDGDEPSSSSRTLPSGS